MVRTAEGPVLLASDAVHYYEECDKNMPFMSVASLIGMHAGFGMIKGPIADGPAVHVVSGHDPDTLGRFAAADGQVSVIGKLGS